MNEQEELAYINRKFGASVDSSGAPWSVTVLPGDVVRYELRPGDVAHAGDAAEDKERVELSQGGRNWAVGTPIEITYRMMIEPGPVNTAQWMVIGQMHTTSWMPPNGVALSPPFAMVMKGERLEVHIRAEPDWNKPNIPAIKLFQDTADIVRGQWYDIRIELRLDAAAGDGGYVRVWRDGVQIVNYTGPLGYGADTASFWKQGIYRRESNETFALQVDDLVIQGAADSFAGTAGDDVFTVDNPADTITGNQGGLDEVRTGLLTYALPEGVERLTFLSGGQAHFTGTGNPLDNTITGGSRADTLMGGAGADTIGGLGQSDWIEGEGGADSLNGGAGADTLWGGAENDTLRGEDGDDRLSGDAGDDSLVGSAGNDTLLGGTGNDTIRSDDGDDSLAGDAGQESLFGGAGADTLWGGAENDTLRGEDGDDRLAGDDGADNLGGGAGNDSVAGGTGNDTLAGDDGNDSLTGDDGNDSMVGGAGSDTLIGGAGQDSVQYGFLGGAGVWTAHGDGSWTIAKPGGTTDRLSGMESARFTNGVLDLSNGSFDGIRLSIAATNASRPEGHGDTTSFTFTVTRTAYASIPVAVDWAVAGSGANPTNADDFAAGQPTSGTLSFAASETSKIITIGIAGDRSVEPTETFAVTLSNPTNSASITTASATGTILGDDAVLSLVATDANRPEGQTGWAPFTFTVLREGGTGVAHSVGWAVTGSGTNPATATDFANSTFPSGTVTLAAGEASKLFTVNVGTNTVIEPDEGFTVTLSGASTGATIGTATANGTILNDDATLVIAATDTSRAEGQAGGRSTHVFTVTREGDTSVEHSVDWAVAGTLRNPASAADFLGGVLPSGRLVFATGETTRTIAIEVAGDAAVEANERFNVTLSGAPAGVRLLTPTATGTIVNDDASFSIVDNGAAKAEGASGLSAFTFLVTRGGDFTTTQSVNWSVTGSGANPANAADFENGVLPSGTVTFAPNEINKIVTIRVVGDAVAEPNERFTVTLSNPSTGAVLSNGVTAEGRIDNDDGAGAVVAAEPAAPMTHQEEAALIARRYASDVDSAEAPWSVSLPADNIIRFEARAGDIWGDFDVGRNMERTEISQAGWGLAIRTPIEISYRMMIEAGDPNTSPFVSIMQMHTENLALPNGTLLGPIFMLTLTGETLTGTVSVNTDPDRTKPATGVQVVTAPPIMQRDQWYDIRVEMLLNAGGSEGEGYVRIWRDGVQIADYNGPVGRVGDTGGYFKQGIYRNAASETLAMQVADLVIEGGANTLTGTAADDVFTLDNQDDAITGDLAGIDEVRTRLQAFTLPDGIEKLTFLGGAQAQFIGTGNALDNTIIGANRADVLAGGLGNDFLDGGLGADMQQGGSGADTLIGNGSGDTLIGGAGNDVYIFDGAQPTIIETADGGIDELRTPRFVETLPDFVENFVLLGTSGTGNGNALANRITGNDADNWLFGRAGDDTLLGLAGADSLRGREDNDSLEGGAGNDNLGGEAGNDTLSGGADNDSLLGGAGNDSLLGDAGADTLSGEDGADTLVGGAGTDSLSGGWGNDLAVFGASDATGGETFSGGGDTDTADFHTAGIADITGVTLTSVETLLLRGAVTLTHGQFAQATSFDGRGDAFSLISASTTRYDLLGKTFAPGFAGLTGSAGADTLAGAAANDTLRGALGDDRLFGSGGTDILFGDEGADTLAGEDGADTLRGGIDNDSLLGGAVADSLFGEDGADTLSGGTGADSLSGGAGNDLAVFVAGDIAAGEAFDGGADIDTADFHTAGITDITGITLTSVETLLLRGGVTLTQAQFAQATSIDGRGAAFNLLGATAGRYDLGGKSLATGFAGLTGSAGADTLVGAAANDTLRGGGENDSLLGGGGNDSLAGDAGADTLSGEDGADTLSGGAGADSLAGGAGNDLAVFAAGDIVAGEAFDGGADIDTADFHTAGITNISGITLTSVETLLLRGGVTLTQAQFAQATSIDGRGDAFNLVGATAGRYDLGGKSMAAAFAGLTGSAGADTLVGASGNDTLRGGGENDSLLGGAGNDSLAGDAGADTLIGGAGADSLAGGTGNDLAVFGAGDIAVGEAFDGGGDTDTADFHAGSIGDITGVTLTSVETLLLRGAVTLTQAQFAAATSFDGRGDAFSLVGATAGRYDLTGKSFAAGFAGLTGSTGADTLVGAAGNDTLRGGSGDDSLVGSTGNDSLFGDAGTDSVQYAFLGGAGVWTNLGNGSWTIAKPGGGTDLLTGIETARFTNGVLDLGTGVFDGITLAIASTNATRAEGQAFAITGFTFTVTRTAYTAVPVSVNWAVTGSGANPADAADFGTVLPSGTVTFAANSTTQDIIVNVAGNTVVEPEEGFTVTLSGATAAARITTATATGTILNDDASFAIAATAAARPEGQSGASTPFTFTVTRTGDTSVAHSVTWAVSGSAVNAADFGAEALPSGTLNFAVGQTSQIIEVPVAGDTTVESTEAFTVTLSGATTGSIIATGTATGSIQNDDAALSIAATNASQAEGNASATRHTFTVTRAGDTSVAHSFTWGVTGSGTNPANAADFAGGVLPGGTLTFAPGETRRTIVVNVEGDEDLEPTEGYSVTLSNPSIGAVITTATAAGSIIADDSTFSIAPITPSVTEGDIAVGTLPQIAFRLTREGGTVTRQVVAWRLEGTGTSPVAGSDFLNGVMPGGSLAFEPGVTAMNILGFVRGDTTPEADETFTITLRNANAGTTILNGVATGSILSDDAGFAIVATDAAKAEGQQGSTPFNFTVTRTGYTGIAHSVNWAVTGTSTTPADAADFLGGVLPSGTVSFAAGETSKIVTVDVAADNVLEAMDRFIVTLSGASAGAVITGATAEGRIQNDDGPLSTAPSASFAIVATDATKAEGQSGTTPFTFTVTRTGATNTTHSVMWSVTGSGDNAATGEDFWGTFPAGTLTFDPGVTTRTISVGGGTGNGVEPDQGFTVTLTGGTAGVTITTASANGMILNDDAAFAIVANDVTKREGHSDTTPFTFTVTRTGDLATAHSVDWAVTTNVSNPIQANDLVGGVLPSGRLDFAVGETVKTIRVDVAGDLLGEADERFTVTLSGASTGSTITAASATSTVISDDTNFSLSDWEATRAEGQGDITPFTFVVARGGDYDTTQSVTWTVTGSGANPANAADFAGGVLPSGIVTFAPGETRKFFTFDVAGDTVTEATESFTVTLSNPTNGAVLAATGTSAQGWIRDEDTTGTLAPLPDAATTTEQAERNLMRGTFGVDLHNSGAPWAFTLLPGDINRYEVRPGDIYFRDAGRGGDLDRSEISYTDFRTMQAGVPMEITYRMMFEPGPDNTNSPRIIIAQMFPSTSSMPPGGQEIGPVFAITLTGNRLGAYVIHSQGYSVEPDITTTILNDTTDLVRGQWYDMRIEALIEHPVGYVRIWRDGTLLADYNGPVGRADENAAFWKQGLYRSTSSVPLAMQIDDLVIQGAADTFTGTAGNNFFSVDNPADRIIGDQGGVDQITTNLVNYTLPDGVENLMFVNVGSTNVTGVGNALDNLIIGSPNADSLLGGAGNDVLNGGAGADTLLGEVGADTLLGNDGDRLVGGAGNDLFWVMSGSVPTIIETEDGGIDELRSSVSVWALPDFVENLTLDGTGTNGFGNSLANRIAGTATADGLYGRAGDDTLLGLAGNDTLRGEDGNDRLEGGAGNDDMGGDAGNDSLAGEAGNDTIWGNDGNDTVAGGDGNDSLWGNAGDDSVTGAAGDDTLWGVDGNDTLVAGADNDRLLGGAGNDSLVGDAGADTLWGEDGADTLVAGPGADSLWGGAGDDLVLFAAGDIAAGEVLDGSSGTDTADFHTHAIADITGITLTSVETLLLRGAVTLTQAQIAQATSFDGRGAVFSLLGATTASYDLAGKSFAAGFAGLTGTTGADTLLGSASADTLRGGADNDSLAGRAGDDMLFGDAGNDTVTAGDGNDTLSGGADNDSLLGGTGNDRLVGEAGADVLSGEDGDDTLLGGAGADSLWGWNGNDLAVFSAEDIAGGDVFTGDAGIDTADFHTASLANITGITLTSVETLLLRGAVTLTQAQFAAATSFDGRGDAFSLVGATAGRYDLAGKSFAAGFAGLTGSAGADTLVGAAGNDTLRGGSGDDSLLGGIGNDSLAGDPGNDTLWGEEGADTLIGGGGADSLSGGAGNDLAVFGPGDIAAGEAFDGGGDTDTADFHAGNIGDITGVTLTSVEALLLRGAVTLTQAQIAQATSFGGRGDAFSLLGATTGSYDLAGKSFAAGFAGLTGTAGADTLLGSASADTLRGGADNDSLAGRAGDDMLFGDAGNDTVTAGDGNDTLSGGADNDSLLGGTGNDSLAGDTGADTLSGEDGADTLIGGSGADSLSGGAGNDLAVFAAADIAAGEAFDGGADIDTADFHTAGITDISGVTLTSVETLLLRGAVTLTQAQFAAVTSFGGRGDAFSLVGATAGRYDLAGKSFAAGFAGLTGTTGADTLVGAAGADTLRGGADNDSLLGGAGNDMLFGGAGNDTVTGGAGSDTVVFSGARAQYTITIEGDSALRVTDSVAGRDGSDLFVDVGAAEVEYLSFTDGLVSLTGGAQNYNDNQSNNGPPILGGSGNDALAGGLQRSIIDGGAGHDVVNYALGLRATWTSRDAMDVLVRSRGESAAFDRLRSVEEVRFADASLQFGLDATVAKVTRLYLAGLGREPDRMGLESWSTAIDNGLDLRSVAGGFIGSLEFGMRFGALDNAGFVERLYLNVLGRNSDPEGRTSWLDALARGASRSDLLVGFSESPENRARTAEMMATGMVDFRDSMAAVARLYNATLGRDPDLEGARGWAGLLDNGTPLRSLVPGFTGSPEFQLRYGTLTDWQFVEQLYRNTLFREADAPGLNNWVQALSGGFSRADVVLGFSESLEHQIMLYTRWGNDGIVFV